MARRHTEFQNRKSLVGAALVGLGVVIFFRSLAEAPMLIRFVRIIGAQADSLGVIAAGSMAVQRGLQGYLFNHSEFLRVVYQVLLSFLGLLFIVMGASLTDVFAAGREGLKKSRTLVDFAASHSTYR